MTNVNIETLRAQLTAARDAAAAAMAERVEVAKLTAELSLLNNEALQEAKAKVLVQEDTNARIDQFVKQCEAIVEQAPIKDRSGKNRTFRSSKRFGFGNTIAELVGLLAGIQYSAGEHNELMLATTGLSKGLIESTLESLGQLSYFNQNHSAIVEGTVGNADMIRANLQLVAQQLGLVIEVNHITQDLLERQEELALLRAQQDEAEAEKAALMQSFVLS